MCMMVFFFFFVNIHNSVKEYLLLSFESSISSLLFASNFMIVFIMIST